MIAIIEELVNESTTSLIEFNDGWNLVGLPLEVDDPSYSTVFPGSTEGTLYGFNGSYYNTEELTTGNGYWIFFDAAGFEMLNGTAINNLTVSLTEGWNLISGITTAVPVNAIEDPNGIIVPGTIYDFDGSYSNAASILPGKGYWVYASANGNITFPGNTFVKKEATFFNRMIAANLISFNGSTLYFGVKVPQAERLSYSLPPKPPPGAGDVRFTGDWKYCEESGEIEVLSNSETITIAYDVPIAAEEGMKWVLISASGREYMLDGSGEIRVSGYVEKFTLKKVKVTVMPLEYALSQNYPNPFNPVTTIGFTLPVDGKVTISVYDLLGREITGLVEEWLSASTHTVVWDASGQSSGVYLVKMTAGEFLQVRKVVLMK